MKKIFIMDVDEKYAFLLSNLIRGLVKRSTFECTVIELDVAHVRLLADAFQSACDQQEDLIGYTETLTGASEINSIRSEYRRLERLLIGGPDV